MDFARSIICNLREYLSMVAEGALCDRLILRLSARRRSISSCKDDGHSSGMPRYTSRSLLDQIERLETCVRTSFRSRRIVSLDHPTIKIASIPRRKPRSTSNERGTGTRERRFPRGLDLYRVGIFRRSQCFLIRGSSA